MDVYILNIYRNFLELTIWWRAQEILERFRWGVRYQLCNLVGD